MNTKKTLPPKTTCSKKSPCVDLFRTPCSTFKSITSKNVYILHYVPENCSTATFSLLTLWAVGNVYRGCSSFFQFLLYGAQLLGVCDDQKGTGNGDTFQLDLNVESLKWVWEMSSSQAPTDCRTLPRVLIYLLGLPLRYQFAASICCLDAVSSIHTTPTHYGLRKLSSRDASRKGLFKLSFLAQRRLKLLWKTSHEIITIKSWGEEVDRN